MFNALLIRSVVLFFPISRRRVRFLDLIFYAVVQHTIHLSPPPLLGPIAISTIRKHKHEGFCVVERDHGGSRLTLSRSTVYRLKLGDGLFAPRRAASP